MKMKKILLLILSSFFAFNAKVISEELREPETIMYIVPENPCEFVTGGKPHLFQDGPISFITCSGSKSFLSINYQSNEGHFSCTFGSGQKDILEPGIYTIDSSHVSPSLYIGGFGRGLSSSIGEFEILEIKFDENGKLLSLAADFKISDSSYSINYVRGAIRFHSCFPVDEYFIRMTDPSFNFSSNQLFYVRKQLAKSSDKKDIITEDKRNLYVLFEENAELKLIVKDTDYCLKKNIIIFNIPNWNSLINKNSFLIEELSEDHIRDNFWDNDCKISDYSDYSKSEYSDTEYSSYSDYSESEYSGTECSSYNDYSLQETLVNKKPSIFLSPKEENDVKAKFGIFTISELIFDAKSKKIISLSIDFIFRDDKENIYDGSIRYNSKIPIKIIRNLK